jgi:NAD(P)-dependent dehydrogenase (short-subunit alcohol dehydrogenase family)
MNQDHKAIFITGSSSGLGRATAKLFASKGWKVIGSMRDPNKEKELALSPETDLGRSRTGFDCDSVAKPG